MGLDRPFADREHVCCDSPVAIPVWAIPALFEDDGGPIVPTTNSTGVRHPQRPPRGRRNEVSRRPTQHRPVGRREGPQCRE